VREVEDARRCLRSSHRDATRTRDADAMTSDDARAYDHLVKILLVGDSGVGKSSLLARFISDSFDEQSPTVGVDFKLKHVDVDGTRLKLTVWDTAGQERFRTLTSSYYRGAHGVVFVYDVTSRESFENARETWRKEVEMYGTIANSVKIVIGNKIDREDERTVAREEGVAFAKEYGCLFLECSAKTKVRVAEAFDELVKGILDAPGLLVDEVDDGVKLGAYADRAGGGCC
jgi:Ras-related protein Rab-18